MHFYGGIDIGSTTTELVIVNEDKEIIHTDKTLTSGRTRVASETLLRRCIEKMNIRLEQIQKITATGYGRKHVEFANNNVTEITCYAKGASFLAPNVRTVIDIGGQDSKVITLSENGEVNDFVMNDKCAAGTGRFLEIIAKIFNLDVCQLGDISSKSTKLFSISSICAVFAESEVISLISQEVKMEDIINSIHNSVGEKIRGMVGRLRFREDLMFCGGVALNVGMVKTLSRLFENERIYVPENADIIGALGAALLAFESR